MGEPINPEAWLWYYKVVGKEKCSIVDTFWQTETGGKMTIYQLLLSTISSLCYVGHVITPLPGCSPMKPGSASFPFFGMYSTQF